MGAYGDVQFSGLALRVVGQRYLTRRGARYHRRSVPARPGTGRKIAWGKTGHDGAKTTAAIMVEKRLAIYTSADGIAELCLNRPDRHNALVPELLDDILEAIEPCRREAGRAGGPDAPLPPRVLSLTATGKSPSPVGNA